MTEEEEKRAGAQILELLKPVADGGDLDAQFELGVMARRGFGGLAKIRWHEQWEKTAAAGHSMSQVCLGIQLIPILLSITTSAYIGLVPIYRVVSTAYGAQTSKTVGSDT